MTPEQKLELSAKRVLPLELQNHIQNIGTLTGSYALGGYIPGRSDVDYIINSSDFLYPFTVLCDYAVEVSQYDDGETYNVVALGGDNEHWNLIFCKDRIITGIWIATTACIISLTNTYPAIRKAMETRENRVHLFHAFRKVLGSKDV